MSDAPASVLHDPWPDEPRVSRALVVALMIWLALLQMGLQTRGPMRLSPLAWQAQHMVESSKTWHVLFDPHLAGFVPPLAPWLAAQAMQMFGPHPILLYVGTLLTALGTLLMLHSLIMSWYGPFRALQAVILLLAFPLFYFSLLHGFSLHLSLFLIMTCVWSWLRFQEEGRPSLITLYHLALAAAVLAGGVLNAVIILASRGVRPVGGSSKGVRISSHLATTGFTLVLFLLVWPLLTWWMHRDDQVLRPALFLPWLAGVDADGVPAVSPAAHILLGLLPWAPIIALARRDPRRSGATPAWFTPWGIALLYIALCPGSPTRIVLLTPWLVVWITTVLATEDYGGDPVRPKALMAVLVGMWFIPALLVRAGWIQDYRAAMPILAVGTLLVGLAQTLPGFRLTPCSRWLLPLGMLLVATFALMKP